MYQHVLRKCEDCVSCTNLSLPYRYCGPLGCLHFIKNPLLHCIYHPDISLKITMATLPIIDISPFLPSSSPERRTPKLRAATAQQVHDACTEYGFFYIAGTGLSDKELHTPLEAAKDFFARPQEEKDALRIQPDDGARGYQRLGQNITQYKGQSYFSYSAPGYSLRSPTADHHEGAPHVLILSPCTETYSAISIRMGRLRRLSLSPAHF